MSRKDKIENAWVNRLPHKWGTSVAFLPLLLLTVVVVTATSIDFDPVMLGIGVTVLVILIRDMYKEIRK